MAFDGGPTHVHTTTTSPIRKGRRRRAMVREGRGGGALLLSGPGAPSGSHGAGEARDG